MLLFHEGVPPYSRRVRRVKVLRERSDDASPRVTNMELFFDLVWWAWNYTAWATN